MQSPARPEASAIVLMCFDGSEDATVAITAAGRVLAPREAVVLTIWEPIAMWEPYNPATIIAAPMARLITDAAHLDETFQQIAEETAASGVEHAVQAGFEARARVQRGKPWRTIRDVADELQPAAIVLGARGRGRIGGTLLGSVSHAVATHARQPVLIVPHMER